MNLENRDLIKIACNMCKCPYDTISKRLGFKLEKRTIIFISVETILKRIISLLHDRVLDDTDYLFVTSGILNIIGHYNNFFKGKNTKNKIYLYGSLAPYEGTHLENFLYDPKNFTNAEFFNKSIKLLDEISIYVPNLFILNGTYNKNIVGSQLSQFVLDTKFPLFKNEKLDKYIPNLNLILISSNPLEYQIMGRLDPKSSKGIIYKCKNRVTLIPDDVICNTFFEGKSDPLSHVDFKNSIEIYRHLLYWFGYKKGGIKKILSGAYKIRAVEFLLDRLRNGEYHPDIKPEQVFSDFLAIVKPRDKSVDYLQQLTNNIDIVHYSGDRYLDTFIECKSILDNSEIKIHDESVMSLNEDIFKNDRVNFDCIF